MTQPPTQPSWLPPEGWYPNPENPEQQRWWDGSAWGPSVTGYEALGGVIADFKVTLPAEPAPMATTSRQVVMS